MRKLIVLLALLLTLNISKARQDEMKYALLLVDIQNDYFDGGANPLVGSIEASQKAKDVLEYFRGNNLQVVHIQHISSRPGSTFFIPNTNGVEIHANVKPLLTEKVITKQFPNSFRDTELLAYLKEQGVTSLVICGMMTHMCVDATVRAAKDYGFTCTVISDACATKDLEIANSKVLAIDVQNAFLAALGYFYAEVIPTDIFIKRFIIK